MRGYADFFYQLNLLPPYLLCLPGDKNFMQKNKIHLNKYAPSLFLTFLIDQFAKQGAIMSNKAWFQNLLGICKT